MMRWVLAAVLVMAAGCATEDDPCSRPEDECSPCGDCGGWQGVLLCPPEGPVCACDSDHCPGVER